MAQTLEFLGLGHPRCGTSFLNSLLLLCNFQIFHEALVDEDKDTAGLVDWSLISADQSAFETSMHPKRLKQFNVINTVYSLRNPYTALPSIVYTEDLESDQQTISGWPKYRLSLINQFKGTNYSTSDFNQIELAIFTVVNFKAMFDQRFNHTTKYYLNVDQLDSINQFVEQLKTNYPDKIIQPPVDYLLDQKVNTRPHKDFEALIEEFDEPRAEFKTMLNNYCLEAGYSKIF